MFPPLAELQNESDVEQKLLLPLLTKPSPEGLSYSQADVLTKPGIRAQPIGKGEARKLYYPDYLVIIAGLPLLVVEAKAPQSSMPAALHEARLYAIEINATFPHGINPIDRVVVCNGEQLWAAAVDTDRAEIELSLGELSSGHERFARLLRLCGRSTAQERADAIRRKFRQDRYERPVNMIGGVSFRDEELAQNTFGATIAGDYGHIFNPKSRQDRELVVREAYVPSLRRQRYIEPIDRLIRNAVAPAAAKLTPLEDTSRPTEIASILRDRRKLENQILLLVGSVGAGKSTFIDYLSLVALPQDIRERTVWLRLNLNEAPLAIELAYDWLARAIVDEFRLSFEDLDFDELETLERVFKPELSSLRKGPLAVLDPKSQEYRLRFADRLMALQADSLALAKGISRYLCSGPDRLLVIVLDNCDKRTRSEQLTMFQVAQWVQSEFRCLVVLPIRDVTFDLHRYDPPLDTILKQLVFRIEPPSFPDVLQNRVRLALEQMAERAERARILSYQLPNGIRVSYPAQDQALYLASILRSVFAHGRFVRQVVTGIAGRDVRKALEIFLDFCMSGHIGEDEIYRIRFLEGKHVLPVSVVARVLLRMQRRFYDGNRSYVKNLVQCAPGDPLPDHFVRLSVLHWFSHRLATKGPAGVEGFHRVGEMVADLAVLGHDAERVREELSYLARGGCVVLEHLRTDRISDEDLAKLTSSGSVHLQLMANPEYLSACAEDTYISDVELQRRVAGRLSKGPVVQFSGMTTARNAKEFVAYLLSQSAEALRAPDSYLGDPARVLALKTLREAEAGVAAAEATLPERLFVGGVPTEVGEEELRAAFESRGIGIKTVTFPRRANSDRGRGFAFIETSDKAAVLEALELDGEIVLQGRRLRVSEAHPSEEEDFRRGGVERPLPKLSQRIYVANLPYSFGQTDVVELLAGYDLTVRDIYLPLDKENGTPRGFAFVEFQTLDDAAKAIGSLDGATVGGRRLLVRPADPKESRK